MKRIALLAALALFCAAGYSQNIVHPFAGTSGGGGTSAGGGFTLLGSAGQAAAGYTDHLDTGMVAEGGLIPPLRQGSGATHTSEMLVQTSWNLMSMPVITPDPTKTVLLPTALSGAFIFLPPPSGYITEDTLLPGAGFWVKFPGVETLTFTGTGLTLDTIPVNAGWNLIGSLTYPLLASDVVPLDGVTILSAYFDFLGGFGYTAKDTLEPGKGYWVKVSQPGHLVLASGSVLIEPAAGSPAAGPSAETPSRSALKLPDGTGILSFRDAGGQSRELYVSGAGEMNLARSYELPPAPPAGIFDVRYASQRSLETFGAGGSPAKEAQVRISGGTWPLEIGYSGGGEDAGVRLAVLSQDGEHEYELAAGATMRLERPGLITVRGRKTSGAAGVIPSEYRLYQNHPNPFNPTTKVTFDLPEAGPVTLLLTNALGQTVATVLDGELEAGRHVIGIDGNDLPTGVYFYRLTAGNFSAARKMLLLK